MDIAHTSIFATAAAATVVGLRNIWRFLYLAGQNGGAVFVVTQSPLAFTEGIDYSRWLSNFNLLCTCSDWRLGYSIILTIFGLIIILGKCLALIYHDASCNELGDYARH